MGSHVFKPFQDLSDEDLVKEFRRQISAIYEGETNCPEEMAEICEATLVMRLESLRKEKQSLQDKLSNAHGWLEWYENSREDS
jgi:hypothetical protein